MRHTLQRTGTVGLAVALAAMVFGCGSSDSSTQVGTGNGTLSGRVLAPDGTTPVAGALVYAPTAQPTRQTPPEESIASDVTDENGNFVLDGLPTGNVLIKFLKGSFTKSLTVNVGDNTVLTDEQGTLTTEPGAGAARIAVVTGLYDRMQDVLAKLGFGEVDANGHLVPGTETFDLYDGDNSLPDTYPEFNDLILDLDRLRGYDIVFLNCGVDEYTAATRVEPDQATVVTNLQTFVTQGGSLYVTDLAYDFVEQAFPAAINFEGSDGTDNVAAEERDAAQVGDSGITSDAEVVDGVLAAWLQARGALNGDGTVHIAGFLSGWAVLETVAETTKIWVQGPISFTDVASRAHGATGGRGRATDTRPLTVSFPSGQGRVIYSSYHTEEEEGGGAELRPQEQILAFLVFEA